jgi:hypothetical protein
VQVQAGELATEGQIYRLHSHPRSGSVSEEEVVEAEVEEAVVVLAQVPVSRLPHSPPRAWLLEPGPPFWAWFTEKNESESVQPGGTNYYNTRKNAGCRP